MGSVYKEKIELLGYLQQRRGKGKKKGGTEDLNLSTPKMLEYLELGNSAWGNRGAKRRITF